MVARTLIAHRRDFFPYGHIGDDHRTRIACDLDLSNRLNFDRYGLGYAAPCRLTKGKYGADQKDNECKYNVVISHRWQKKPKVVVKVKTFFGSDN